MTYCAECGKPLETHTHGAFKKCCSGLAYWYDGEILPQDAWFPVEVRSGRFVAYVNPKFSGRLVRPQDGL